MYFSAVSPSSLFRLLTLAHLRTYARGEARNYVTIWKSVFNLMAIIIITSGNTQLPRTTL